MRIQKKKKTKTKKKTKKQETITFDFCPTCPAATAAVAGTLCNSFNFPNRCQEGSMSACFRTSYGHKPYTVSTQLLDNTDLYKCLCANVSHFIEAIQSFLGHQSLFLFSCLPTPRPLPVCLSVCLFVCLGPVEKQVRQALVSVCVSVGSVQDLVVLHRLWTVVSTMLRNCQPV